MPRFPPSQKAHGPAVPIHTREVASRSLPVPDTVSPQMQAIIAAPFNSNFNFTPETTAEWKERVSANREPCDHHHRDKTFLASFSPKLSARELSLPPEQENDKCQI